MMSEKIELIGKGLYKDIPDQLTLKAFPTVTELNYVSSEEFDKTMIEEIFPECIEEKVNFYNLFEVDFQWVCRCMRFLNYGPYFTTNMFLCENCGTIRQEGQVDLRVIDVKSFPEGFTNDIVIKKDDLIDYNQEIHLHMLTIGEVLNLRKDKMFKKRDGSINTQYARICYSITSMGQQQNITPITAKLEIENRKKFSPADFKVLETVVSDLTDYGLRGGGKCVCPNCGGNSAIFVALADDRFFRPAVGDLRRGKNDRSTRGIQNSAGNTSEVV